MMNRIFASVVLGVLVANLGGCSTTGLFKSGHNDFPHAGPNNPVTEILGVWQPGTGLGLDNKPTRGFTGQVLFFAHKGDSPVQIDGEVQISVYDDQGTPAEQVQAIHNFDFAPRAWNALLDKGPLGATYNVFVPYTRAGRHEAKCAIRIRYTPKAGSPVYSEMVNIVLEGKKKSTTTDSPANSSDGNNYDETPANAAAVRKPPHVHGLTDSIPMTADLQASRNRRHAAVELTDEEKARIIREARARLKAETDGRVALVSHEEFDAEENAESRRSAIERPRKPTRNKTRQVVATDLEPAESVDDDESAARPARRGLSPRSHVLADDDTFADTNPQSDSRSSRRKARVEVEEAEATNPRRHPLEEE